MIIVFSSVGGTIFLVAVILCYALAIKYIG